jgi:hypothetical protein
MPALSPLDDNSMYLQLAQAAQAKGMPPGGPAGQTASPEKIPPQVIQKFISGLSQIIPNLQPPQLQAVIQLLQAAFAQEDSLEPNEPQGM